MPTSTVDDLDQLQKELRDFKSMPESQLPEFDNTSPSSVDHFWANIGDMMQPGNSEEKRFEKLKYLQVLLVLPHSTADAERLFSMIKKIETEQRSSLSPTTVRKLLKSKVTIIRKKYTVVAIMYSTYIVTYLLLMYIFNGFIIVIPLPRVGPLFLLAPPLSG